MGAVVATGPSTSTVPVMLSIDVGRVALVEVALVLLPLVVE